ncbi:hypothetical protein ACIQ9P_35195, partial [Kitasatospora sp. NPDC094019]|uniref:hypothetical protein n=1 Tax=Kitasatospora sp. NPDC094019 TaxID=3364091 RepID=UPI00381EE8D6
ASFVQLAGVFCGLTPRPTFQTLADPRPEKRIRPQSSKMSTTKQTIAAKAERHGAAKPVLEVVFRGLAAPGPSALTRVRCSMSSDQ